MPIKKIEQIKITSPRIRKDISESADTNESSRIIQGINEADNFLTEELEEIVLTQKISIPESDQEKFNIHEEDIISEKEYATAHTYVLKDGRTITYKKDENNNLTLYQVYKTNQLAKIEKNEIYDEQGNITTVTTYEYDIDGHLISTQTINKVNNTTQITEYNKETITETTTAADGKVLRVGIKELNENGVDVKETVEDYYYNEQGQKIMTTSVDKKTGKKSTNFYNEQGEVQMTFPFDILGEDSAIKETGYDGLYDYSDRTRLGQQITEALTPQEIEEINQKINQNVNSAGRGTGEGVAAALTTLITEFQNKGIMLPYFAGGEHEPEAGINPEWGKYEADASANRFHKSGDCTGIIAWAMETGGIECPDNVAYEAEQYGHMVPTAESLEKNPIKPGTILAFGVGLEGHDILVVNTYTDDAGQKHLVCAQSKGGGVDNANANADGDSSGGVVLTDYTYTIAGDVKDSLGNTGVGIKINTTYEGGDDPNTYGIYDMEEYYQNHKK